MEEWTPLVEHCPICGGIVHTLCYPVFPPIYGKHCFGCGWDERVAKMQQAQKQYDDDLLRNVKRAEVKDGKDNMV